MTKIQMTKTKSFRILVIGISNLFGIFRQSEGLAGELDGNRWVSEFVIWNFQRFALGVWTTLLADAGAS